MPNPGHQKLHQEWCLSLPHPYPYVFLWEQENVSQVEGCDICHQKIKGWRAPGFHEGGPELYESIKQQCWLCTTALEDGFKNLDDLTVVEVVNLLNIGLSTARVRDTVPSDLPEHNQLIDNKHLKSQKYLGI